MTSVEVWTVQQVAKFLGISEQAVRKALKDKRLEGKKFGNAWMIDSDRILNTVSSGYQPRKKQTVQ